MYTSIVSPFPVFNDLDGNPLENGFIYIGTQNLNPTVSPIPVFWDEALTQPAAQPLRTIGGFFARAGTPSRVYVAEANYSILVTNSNREIVYSELNALNNSGGSVFNGYPIASEDVDFLQSGTDAVLRTVESKLTDFVSVKDFGAVGDGTANDTDAFKKAIASGRKNILIPTGTYILRSTLILPKETNFIGEGKGTLYSTDSATTLYWDQTPSVSDKKQWTDIGLGQDNFSFAPCLVLGGSSCTVSNLNIKISDQTINWSAGIFIPATKQHEIRSIKIEGAYASAGLHIDATWSDRNETLKALNPSVDPDGGPLEVNVLDSYITGIWSVKIQGTARDGTGYTTATWPFAWLGTSDIVFTNCQLRPSASTQAPSVSADGGGIYVSSKVMFTDGVVAQARGPKLVACAFRISAPFIAKLDWCKENVFIAPMGETQSAYRNTYASAWFHVTSNTDITSISDNSIQYCQFAQNGTIESGVNSYLNSSSKPKIVFSCVDTGKFQSPFLNANWGTNNRDTEIKGFGSSEAISFLRQSTGTYLFKTFQGTDGPILRLNSASVICSETTGANNAALYFWAGFTPVFYITKPSGSPQLVSYGPVRPDDDGVQPLGLSSKRWGTVYAATGTINTSDKREKQQIRSLSETEKAVALKLKSLVKAFKFNDAVAKKGNTARTHVGVMAQDVIEAFASEGLNSSEYGILCYDEWSDEIDEDGKVLISAGNRYGIRYEELLAFIIASL